MINLDKENYYTQKANLDYLSVSQYKEFAGTYGRAACEAAAMARLNGEWQEEPTTAMLIGSYVDSYFEGTLTEFRESHPQIFKRDGNLKADYAKAEQIISRAERDPLFSRYLSGEKQVIMTGEIGGQPWKIKMDSYIPGRCIVDLKVMQSLSKMEWVRDIGYLDFVRYWGYDIQGAVYQEIVYQNTGMRLPFYIAGVSKEKEPDIAVIHVADVFLQEALSMVETNIQNIVDVKTGARPPIRCECCDYCHSTKVLTAPIGLDDLAMKV